MEFVRFRGQPADYPDRTKSVVCELKSSRGASALATPWGFLAKSATQPVLIKICSWEAALLRFSGCLLFWGRFHLEDKKIKNKYAYPEDVSMAEAAAREMNLEWKHHIMDLAEAGQRLGIS